MAAMDRSACVASCSGTSPAAPLHPIRRQRPAYRGQLNQGCQPTTHLHVYHHHNYSAARHRPMTTCWASKSEPIQGYTPANYINYTDSPELRCHHMVAVDVEAPASICFDLWDDWCRLVDFLDLVAQIGLDPAEPDMGLFQCFYRWGRMPVMEVVFLARKTHVEQDKLIMFDTVWGMPASGEVGFVANSPTSTTVIFKLEHQLPWLLVDLKVGVMGVESQLRDILHENLADFKTLAESLAQDPSLAPPRQQAESKRQQQAAAQQEQEADQQEAAQPNQGEPQQSEPGQGPGTTQQPELRPSSTWDGPAQPGTPSASEQQVPGGQGPETPPSSRRRSRSSSKTLGSSSPPSSFTPPRPPAASKRLGAKPSARNSQARTSPTRPAGPASLPLPGPNS